MAGCGPCLGASAGAGAVARTGAAPRRALDRARPLRPERAPERLALLPGRRPDLVLDLELAPRARVDHPAERLLRLARRPAALLLDRRARFPERAAADRPPTGARLGSDRPLLRLRHRCAHRWARHRLLRCARLDDRALRRDSTLRPQIPREV